MADRSATPAAERVHIAFFGRRNAGKSSLVNVLTGQSVAIVSPVAGTTTDPVRKSMELLPLGPVVMIDTPGLDDEGEVGSLRVGRALRELNRADIAVLVVDAAAGMADEDRALLRRFEQKGLPHLTVFNKCDLRAASCGEGELAVSARTGEGVEAGSNITLSIGQRSATYDTLVPNSALRNDANGDFVLVVTAKNTPLGNRYTATRVGVTVLAKDDTKSAVTGLSSGDFVITTSTAPIEAGSQVRLVDNG